MASNPGSLLPARGAYADISQLGGRTVTTQENQVRTGAPKGGSGAAGADNRQTDGVVIDAELVDPISREDAQRLDKHIRLLVGTINESITKLHALVEEAKRGDIHVALGFPSWTAYLTDAFAVQVRLGREQRRELVGYLSGEGMSQRAIATVIGVDQKTVGNDLRSGEEFSSPDVLGLADGAELADCVAMADVDDAEFEAVLADARTEGDLSRENVSRLCRERSPEDKTVGRDGKEYRRRKRRPANACPDCGAERPTWLGATHICQAKRVRKAARQPITNEARSIGLDLAKITKRLDRLLADDRFTRNREEIGCRIRPYNERCADALARLNQNIDATYSLNTLARVLQMCAIAAASTNMAGVEDNSRVQSVATIRDCIDALYEQVERW